MYTQAHTQTHTCTTWCGQYVRAKHYLAFEPFTSSEVWINAAGKICSDDKQLGDYFPPVTALKVKESHIFPKHWLVHVECLYCAVLYLWLLFRVLTEGYVGSGRVFHNQRHFSYDFYSAAVLSQSRPRGSCWWPRGAFKHITAQVWLCKSRKRASLCREDCHIYICSVRVPADLVTVLEIVYNCIYKKFYYTQLVNKT